MFRLVLLCLAILPAFSSLAQSDTIFLKEQPDFLLGTAEVQFKKQRVTVKPVHGKSQLIPLDKIREIRFTSGRRVVSKVAREQERLLEILVSGQTSLLFDRAEKQFYFERNDSIFTVLQDHIVRALPIIFGEKRIQEYYASSHVKPIYSAQYLTRLTSFVNQGTAVKQTVYQEALKGFKTTVSAGVYVGIASNSTAFDYFSDYEKGIAVYRPTDFFWYTSVPVGLRFAVQPFRRVSIDLNVYMNKGSVKGIAVDKAGTFLVSFPESLIHPERYDTNLKLTEYASTMWHTDLSFSVFLNKKENARLKPYVFAGPAIAQLFSYQAAFSATYRESANAPATYITRSYQSDARAFMIAFHGGFGVKYALTDKWALRLSAQYSRGLFPKVHAENQLVREENNTSVKAENFGRFDTIFITNFDQYIRSVSGGISLMYQF
ncbi:hypothetical protein [Dyadobacter sandarakinus]|uniref:Outer membrane protein beta-barrel domain-containing protein n=1 Tax=Dyadobacter sandarakinus TaxID=2747268 RepID=A0ABX7I7E5_9BACT|nr:hypothetical protein [Dyadobacter sandarakinus]QRR02027.1 hypothetical protein HWI92_14480 [Dyadobacter sandarakinus]